MYFYKDFFSNKDFTEDFIKVMQNKQNINYLSEVQKFTNKWIGQLNLIWGLIYKKELLVFL